MLEIYRHFAGGESSVYPCDRLPSATLPQWDTDIEEIAHRIRKCSKLVVCVKCQGFRRDILAQVRGDNAHSYSISPPRKCNRFSRALDGRKRFISVFGWIHTQRKAGSIQTNKHMTHTKRILPLRIQTARAVKVVFVWRWKISHLTPSNTRTYLIFIYLSSV